MSIQYSRFNIESTKIIDDLVYDQLSVKCFVAGGCWPYLLLGKKPNDIDVFFWDKNELSQAIAQYSKVAKLTYENSSVINWELNGYKVQFIKRFFYKSSDEIFTDFDFTLVKASYDGSVLTTDDRFLIDLYAKKLVINETLVKPLSSLSRAFKYVKRGYSICPVGIARLAKNVDQSNIDWDNPNENEIEFYPDGTPKFAGLD